MRYAVLDTNFILSCIGKKIDFFNEIKFMGFVIIIPNEVLREIKQLSESGGRKAKEESKIALNILEKNNFEKIALNSKNVDNGIVKIAKENKEYIIATLDREIKNKIKNSKLVIRGDKKLEII